MFPGETPMEVPVRKLRIWLIGPLLAGKLVSAQTTDYPIPTLENSLELCFSVTMKGVEQTQFGTFVLASLVNKQSTAACGCKSALSSYSVVETFAPPRPGKGVKATEWMRIYATFLPFKLGDPPGLAKDFAFMLQAADGRPASNIQTTLRLSCGSN